jgi:uncharacterized peroxidase-related enzyme
MQRLSSIDPARAEGKTKQVLDAVAKAMGGVPNMAKAMAASPALLEGYLALLKALSSGKLDRKLHDQLALAVAGANGCDYCASAHTLLGQQAGVAEEDLLAGLQGHARDPKTDAALQFARAVNDKRGRVSDDDLAKVRAAGWDDGAIGEIIGHVALNVLTNYFNIVADTDIDFPVVRARPAAA